jgi:putative DNA primase/helicase
VPLTFCENIKTGRRAWRFKGFREPRPLYGLERLASAPEATVIIVEGEKCASALQKSLDAAGVKDYVAATWLGGGKAVGRANWSSLYGRDVVIWPDHDQVGFDAALAIARLLEGARI